LKINDLQPKRKNQEFAFPARFRAKNKQNQYTTRILKKTERIKVIDSVGRKGREAVPRLLGGSKVGRDDRFALPVEVIEWTAKAAAMINFLGSSVERLSRENQAMAKLLNGRAKKKGGDLG
jgi:hypothetical protein